MTLLKEYRDDLLKSLQDEPEQTFYELGIKKDDVLLDEELIDMMWARYQKYIQQHKEDTPRSAMVRALKSSLIGPSTSQTLK